MHVALPLEVTCKGVRQHFYVQFLGTKGDWPWLRAAYRLYSGFTSTRKCHLCPINDPWFHVMQPFYFISMLGHCKTVPDFSIGFFLAHAKDWHDFGPSSETRRWPSNGHNPDPWHRGPPASLRGILPNGDSPSMVKVDLAHTYAIAGWGKDMLASMLVFLANRCKAWGGTNIDVQLDAAYDSFFDWCVANKKTSTIKSFCKEELKIVSILAINNVQFTSFPTC